MQSRTSGLEGETTWEVYIDFYLKENANRGELVYPIKQYSTKIEYHNFNYFGNYWLPWINALSESHMFVNAFKNLARLPMQAAPKVVLI